MRQAKKLEWGTWGLAMDGDIHKMGPGPIRLTTLGECDSEHLHNILVTQSQLTYQYRRAILDILNDRCMRCMTDTDESGTAPKP